MAVNTDDSITESRFYLRTGAIAVRGGMSEMQALKALTSTPAKLLHLDHRIGSLEKGKDADFVVLSGRPFSTYTQVLETYIDRGQLARLRQPTITPSGRRTPGLKLDDPRLLAVMQALTCFAHVARAGRFRTRDLHQCAAEALGLSPRLFTTTRPRAWTITGARPSVISSSSRSLAPVRRMRAMASICCSPPESLVPCAVFLRSRRFGNIS